MTLLFALLLSTLTTGDLNTPYIKTPQQALKFAIGDDHRKWIRGYSQRAQTGFIRELVPDGQKIQAWKVMVADQINFSSDSLSDFVEHWKAVVTKSDPNIQMVEEPLGIDSIVVEYTSIPFHETAIRRFIKGSDGVYVLAYHVRPDLRQDGEYKIWLSIIERASLTTNPEIAMPPELPESPPLPPAPQSPAPTAQQPQALVPATGSYVPQTPAQRKDGQEVITLIVSHMGKDFFPPPTATMNDIAHVLQGYCNAHPELHDRLTDAQILRILIDKYPPPIVIAPANNPAGIR